MIKHYLKIAFRNLARQKALTAINIAGLSIGLACFSLFLFYAVNEFSFDRFHKNAANIYRVYLWSEAKGNEEAKGGAYHPMPLAPAMKQDFVDVKNYVRFKDGGIESFIKAADAVTREKFSYADPSFFSVFSFKLKYGDKKTALKDLHSVVLTETTAKKIFGKIDPVGKTIEIKTDDAFVPFTVTAIAENIPSNSSIQFNILGNFNYLATTASGAKRAVNWHQYSYETYVELRPGSHLPGDKSLLMAFRKKYYPDEEERSRKSGWKGKGPRTYFGLQPISSIHTDTTIFGAEVPPVNPKNIWILLAIATGVLLIACINFTTLAIGRSANRAKEIGVRKVVGSDKKQLVVQFLAEALLLSIVSMIIGLFIGKLLLPYFNQLSGRELKFSFSQYPQLSWMLGGLVLIVGLLAGSYPAIILSSFKPIEVLKSKIRVGGANVFTRSLVTVQFILSIGLIISTAIILQQLNFMEKKNPGFNKENIVIVDAEGVDTKKVYPRFRQALMGQSSVDVVAGSELGLGEGTGWSMSGFEYKGQQKNVFEYFIDTNYINLMGIQLIKGRNFSPDIVADTVNSVIVNEAMVKDFGWTIDNAVGQELKGYYNNGKQDPVVVGVVKDFNFLSLSEKVGPQMFDQFRDYAPYKYFVKIKPGNPSVALTEIRRAWTSIVPDLPLKYDFLDENLNRFYKSESRWSNIVGCAGAISIFLACLGLFGLAALAAVNRTKEIGIRKVLGASVSSILGLLSKDFLRLVIIAIFIASPLAWYFMNKWLQDFAYRINIGWLVFFIAGASASLLALMTISFQAIKAAVANPVKSLRTE